MKLFLKQQFFPRKEAIAQSGMRLYDNIYCLLNGSHYMTDSHFLGRPVHYSVFIVKEYLKDFRYQDIYI